MPHRKNTVIKTRYRSVESCRNFCRDIVKPKLSRLSRYAAYRGEAGEIVGDVAGRSFNLTTSGLFTTNYQFVGQIVERDGHIYMIGDISMTSGAGAFLFIIHLFILMAMLCVVSTGQIVFLAAVMVAIDLYCIFNDNMYESLMDKFGVAELNRKKNNL